VLCTSFPCHLCSDVVEAGKELVTLPYMYNFEKHLGAMLPPQVGGLLNSNNNKKTIERHVSSAFVVEM